MSTIEALGLLAALVHLTGYLVYNLQIKKGDSTPNLTSWSLFTLLAIINAVSYYGIDTAAWHEAGPPFVGALASALTLIHAVSSGKFQRPTGRELIVLMICISAIGAYLIFKNAAHANFIVIAAALIAFWPLFDAARRNPMLERPPAWIVWTCGYGLLLLVVSFGAHWEKLVLPFVAGFLHTSIILLSRRSRRERFARGTMS